MAQDSGSNTTRTEEILVQFFEGCAEAGEELLYMSGAASNFKMVDCSILIMILKVKLFHDDVRIVELSCGIVANMILNSEDLDSVLNHLEVVPTMIDICLTKDDPVILSEALRVITNLVYRGKSSIVLSRFDDLKEFVLFVVANSLSPRLLSQICQFVYYILIYSTKAEVLHWLNDTTILAYYGSLLESKSEPVENSEANADILKLLKSELLGEYTGLEWMLLSLDKITGEFADITSVQSLLRSRFLIEACLSLLLQQSHSEWSWDSDRPRSVSHKRLTNYSIGEIYLLPSEKSLLLCIVESIVSKHAEGVVLESPRNLAPISLPSPKMYITHHIPKDIGANEYGFSVFLRTVLDTCEEAVLMRDLYAVSAACYLICVLGTPVLISDTTSSGPLKCQSSQCGQVYSISSCDISIGNTSYASSECMGEKSTCIQTVNGNSNFMSDSVSDTKIKSVSLSHVTENENHAGPNSGGKHLYKEWIAQVKSLVDVMKEAENARWIKSHCLPGGQYSAADMVNTLLVLLTAEGGKGKSVNNNLIMNLSSLRDLLTAQDES